MRPARGLVEIGEGTSVEAARARIRESLFARVLRPRRDARKSGRERERERRDETRRNSADGEYNGEKENATYRLR